MGCILDIVGMSDVLEIVLSIPYGMHQDIHSSVVQIKTLSFNPVWDASYRMGEYHYISITAFNPVWDASYYAYY